MVKFMVLGAPRSGTTWACNWLMQEGEKCAHDPFMGGWTPQIIDDSGMGISCTSSVVQYPEWIKNHSAPKVILHREYSEINSSLANLGLPSIDGDAWHKALKSIKGLHVQWWCLFDPPVAGKIFTHLTGRKMNPDLHLGLRDMNVQVSANIIRDCQRLSEARLYG